MAGTLLLGENGSAFENIFKPYGQVPSDGLIDPLWTDLLFLVQEAWLALDSGFMHPMLACLPGAMESPLPLNCVNAAPYEQ